MSGTLPESGFASPSERGGKAIFRDGAIPASLLCSLLFPALPCNPVSFSLLFALGRSSSNSLLRNDFQL
jgi:hypothetical protein